MAMSAALAPVKPLPMSDFTRYLIFQKAVEESSQETKKAGSADSVESSEKEYGEQIAAEVSLEEELVSFDAASLLRVRIVNRKYGVKQESKHVRYATTSDGVKVTAVLTDAAAIPDEKCLS